MKVFKQLASKLQQSLMALSTTSKREGKRPRQRKTERRGEAHRDTVEQEETRAWLCWNVLARSEV